MLSDLTTLVHQNVTKLLLSSVSMVALLFSASEPGQLMPVDPAYLYQDTAGTTPVTATGQAVALQLDQSKGLVLGPELVTNGDFSTPDLSLITASAGNTVSIVNGRLRITRDGSITTFGGGSLNISGLVSGRYYQLVISCISGTLTAVNRARLNEFQSAYYGDNRASGTYVFNSAGSTLRIDFGSIENANSGFFEFDNISVRELPGNHDTQPTVGSRPIYGKHPANGYRNMLAVSEQFDNAAWTKKDSTISVTQFLAPDGATTADKVIPNSGAQTLSGVTRTLAAGVGYTYSIFAKAAEFSWLALETGNRDLTWFNLSAGVTGTTSANHIATISPAGNGWYRCSITVVTMYNGAPQAWVTSGNASQSVTGDGTSGILIWGAQLETGSTATTYQRTGASSGVAWPAPPSYDITEAGQADLHYLHYNGVSSFMVSPTITPGIDKAQVFVGVRWLVDFSYTSLIETSTAYDTNNGVITLGRTGSWIFGSKGTVGSLAQFSKPSPTTDVVSGIGDIAGDKSTLRVNGTQVAQSVSDQGTGNFLAYPIYTGRRGGTGFAFNGLVYSKIVRFGPNLTADQIASTDRWTGQRTGVAI